MLQTSIHSGHTQIGDPKGVISEMVSAKLYKYCILIGLTQLSLV